MTLASILGVTLAMSLLGLTGGLFLIWQERFVHRSSRYFLSFAAGSILGAALLELLPEALDRGTITGEQAGMYGLFGIIIFFILEKLLIMHHHSHDHAMEVVVHRSFFHSLKAARPLVIVGDAFHNFLDGAVIAIAFCTDLRVGIITALAVIAHELPQEIGDFSILIHSGMKKSRVIAWNVLGAFVSPLGALVGYSAFSSFAAIEAPILAIVVGNFIYLALADLFPTIKHEPRLSRSALQIGLLLFGIALMWWIGVVLREG
jgi:zinc and cadmium transporter